MNLTPFLNALRRRLMEYKDRTGLTYFDNYAVFGTETTKYFKIYKQEIFRGEKFGFPNMICFVDKTTGDIYKCAGAKAPAKHSRGNINSPEQGMEAFSPDGFVKYLR